MPEDFEPVLLRYWTPRRRPVTLDTEGGHLLEAVLDNRHGDAFMLWAVLMEQMGGDWRAVMEDSRFEQNMELLVCVDEAQFTADLANPDTLTANVRMVTDSAVGANLAALFNFVMPTLKTRLTTLYNLEVDGEFAWSDAEGALVGDFTITGIRAELARQRDLLAAAQS